MTSTVGISSVGRATSNCLDLNDERHNQGSIAKIRCLWIKGGWHPPGEEPQQVKEF